MLTHKLTSIYLTVFLIFFIRYADGQDSRSIVAQIEANVEASKINEQWDSTILCYQTAIHKLEKTVSAKPDTTIFRAIINLSDSLGQIYKHKMSEFPAAIEQYGYLLRLAERYFAEDFVAELRAREQLGNLYGIIGEYERAMAHEEKGLEIVKKHFGSSHPKMVALLLDLGADYSNLDQHQMALEHYHRALKLIQDNEIRNSQRLKALRSIAIAYMDQGDYKRAENFLLQALHMADNPSAETALKSELPYLYTDLGNLNYYLANYGRTIEYYEKVLRYYETNRLSPILRGIVCNNIGGVLLRQDKYEEALPYLRQAINYVSGVNPKHKHLITFYANVSTALMEMDRFAEAMQFIDKNEQLIMAADGGVVHLSMLYASRAGIYIRREAFGEALEHYDQAIEMNLLDCAGPGNILDKIRTCPIANRENMLFLVKQIAAIYSQERADLDLDTRAFERVEVAIHIIARLRNQLYEEQSNVHLQEGVSDIYGAAVRVAFALYDRFGELKYLNRALQWIEDSRNVRMISALKHQKALLFGGVPREILLAEAAMRDSLRLYEQRLIQAGLSRSSPEVMQSMRSALLMQSLQYDSLKLVLERQYPKYYNYKFAGSVPDIAAIQETIDSRTWVITYLLGKSSLFRMAIGKDSVRINQFPIDDEFARELQSTYSYISDQRFAASADEDYLRYAHLAYRLYQLLIPEGLSSGTSLLIVPDGKLGYLPFEALLTAPPGRSPDLRSPPFLIEQYPISYAHSLTEWLEDRLHAPVIPLETSYIGFAPSYQDAYFPLDSSFSPLRALRNQPMVLPGAVDEVKYARDLFAGVAYYGDKASENKFKNLDKNTGILHLAMHALVDDEQPMISRLLFEPIPDAAEDGNLRAFEIYNLKLNSQLLVLSACETGYGKMQHGEGIMSLARAFQYAGVRSLVTSLWKADDETTRFIIQHFFLNLKAGQSKAEALRNAKLLFLDKADKVKTAPFYWANFVLIGDETAMNITSGALSTWRMELIGLILLSALLILFVPSIKRKINMFRE